MNSPAIPLKTNSSCSPAVPLADEVEKELRERIAAAVPVGPQTKAPGRAALQFLKRTAHRLPHPLLLRAFLLKYALHELRVERQARIKNELIPLGNIDLSRHKKSDTVFLLGSGPSINAIDEKKWRTIARHDSMAVNFWLFHKFVPTFYFYEAIGPRHGKTFEVFRGLSNDRAHDYARTIKVVTGLELLAPELNLCRPEAWSRDLYTAYTVPVAARNEREFVRGLHLAKSLGLFKRTPRIDCFFKQGSSVTGLISLAVRMGYKRIVLCGIDLHNGHYFYQDPKLYWDAPNVEFQDRNAPHKLVTPQPWKVLTDAAVITIKREILDPLGIEIFVENRSSRLWPAIKEARASIFESN